MRTKICLLICVVLFGFTIVSCSKIKKARELVDAKMYQQAIAILEPYIQKQPKNPESHFLIGECYLNERELSKASKSFERAIALEPNYSKATGEIMFATASELIRKGSKDDFGNAVEIFNQSAMLLPEKKIEICMLMIETARSLIKTNPTYSALFLKSALSFNELIKDEITTILIENKDIIEKTGGSTTVDLLYDIGKTSLTHKNVIANIIFNIAKRDELLNEMKSFSQYYSKAVSLNEDISRCPEIECGYYYALDKWIKKQDKLAEKEFYNMFKKEPTSEFVKKIKKQIAPNGDIVHLEPNEKKQISIVYKDRNIFWLSTGSVECSTNKGGKGILKSYDGVMYKDLTDASREGTKIYLKNTGLKPVSIFYVISSGISYN